MNSHLWGNYLLEHKYLTAKELYDAMYEDKDNHELSLPVIAIYEEALTAVEVNRIEKYCEENFKDFRTAVLDLGYFNEDSLNLLLHQEYPSYLHLAQELIDKKTIDYKLFQDIMVNYHSDTEMFNEQHEDEIDETISSLLASSLGQSQSIMMYKDYFCLYMKLLFQQLADTVDSDYTPLPPMECPEYPSAVLVSQKGTFDDDSYFYSALAMEEDDSIRFANCFAANLGMEPFNEYNEYVLAAIEDFLNTLNGFFAVNISNIHTKEFSIDPPQDLSYKFYAPTERNFLLPIVFSFGTINFILSIQE
ncbi:hypothetical protein [Eubacterium oxidoreducens]|uniref:Chemotaxis phosphatase CheX n=1 Tax=Eubacterium oxidoreducens TaxID=1732 RepID=A0A1G6AKD4_EUBOX|nr:hypothetical protein [Eubacterium oxidoreducens]SDB08826.1 hypothetical protein SAMN02910417_00622 [Eubacterium oxidoreducens]